MGTKKKIIRTGAKRAPGAGRPKKGGATSTPIDQAPVIVATTDADDAYDTYLRLQATEASLFKDYEKGKEAFADAKGMRREEMESSLRTLHSDWMRTSKEKLRAEKDVLVIQQMTGDLVPVADVRETWSQMLTIFKTRLESMPAALAPKLEGLATKDIAAALAETVEKALVELSATNL